MLLSLLRNYCGLNMKDKRSAAFVYDIIALSLERINDVCRHETVGPNVGILFSSCITVC